MSKIMIFVKGMGDGAGDWCDIDEENLDLTEHNAIIREDAIDECIEAIDSWVERQKCFKGTLKYISTNLCEELEKLKEHKNE